MLNNTNAFGDSGGTRRSKSVRLLSTLLYLSALVFVIYSIYELFHLIPVLSGAALLHRYHTLDSFPDSENTEPVIPKIIHQMYWTNDTKYIPAHWQESQKLVKAACPDYEYKFWTDDMLEDLIATEYSWLLPTWKSYPHVVQRSDVSRYVILHKYGGIYVDMDIGFRNGGVEYLRKYDVVLITTYPIGVTNDFMMGRPNDPFFYFVLELLPSHNFHYWGSTFIQVMVSSGPVFISYCAHVYGQDRVKRLPQDLPQPPGNFFRHVTGNSWHSREVWLYATLYGILNHGWGAIAFYVAVVVLLVVAARLLVPRLVKAFKSERRRDHSI